MSIEELKKKLKSYTFHFSIFCKVQAEAEVLEKEKTGTLNAGKSVSDNDGMPRGTRTSDATFDKVVRMIEYDERIKELQKEANRHEEQMRIIEKLVAKIKDERQRHFVWTFYCRDEESATQQQDFQRGRFCTSLTRLWRNCRRFADCTKLHQIAPFVILFAFTLREII